MDKLFALIGIEQDEKEKFKSKSNIPIRNSKRPNSLSKSPLEKRKVLNPRSTVLRKINNSRLSSNTTQSSQGKPTSAGKNTHPISKDTLNYVSLKNKPMTSTILEIETSESKNDDETHTNVVNAPNPKQSVSNLYREKSKSDIALQSIIAENDIDKEADIQRNVYRNLESDPISLFVDADKSFTTITNNKPNTTPTSPLKSNENVKDPNKNNINMQSIKQDEITKEIKNSNDLGIQKSTISIADIIKNRHDNECTINFNLNIEVKDFSAHSKYNGDTFTKIIRLNSDKIAKQSQTNLQVDLDKDIITTNNYINQLNAIDPLDGRSCFGCQNKVVIIRCSCNEKTSHNSLTQNNTNPKESAVVLSKDENISERFEDVKNIEDQDGEENKRVTIKPEGMINREDTTSKIHSVKEYNVSRSTCSPEISATLAKSSKNQEDVQNCDKLTIPSSTQTEWCNILVEARCNEEGNYSFHLPSIEKLKEFNL
ncbi:unnamed protein product [Colias eurytheme]|nr:unnamed protein product [Colias eurytheme]